MESFQKLKGLARHYMPAVFSRSIPAEIEKPDGIYIAYGDCLIDVDVIDKKMDAIYEHMALSSLCGAINAHLRAKEIRYEFYTGNPPFSFVRLSGEAGKRTRLGINVSMEELRQEIDKVMESWAEEHQASIYRTKIEKYDYLDKDRSSPMLSQPERV